MADRITHARDAHPVECAEGSGRDTRRRVAPGDDFAEFFSDDLSEDESDYEDFIEDSAAETPEAIAHIPEWQELYAEGVDVLEAMRSVFPELAEAEDATVEAELASMLEGMSPEEQENFFKSLGRIARKAVSFAAPIVSAAAPIVGTAIGGPIGGAVGGVVSRAVGALGARGRGRPRRMRPRGRRPVRRLPRRAAAGPGGAVTQLLSLIQNPQVQSALLGVLRGGSGLVSPTGESVSAEVVATAINQASLEALREMEDGGIGQQPWEGGYAAADFASAEQALDTVLSMVEEVEDAEFSHE